MWHSIRLCDNIAWWNNVHFIIINPLLELGTDLSVVTNNTVITTGADGGGDDAKYFDPEQSEIFETQPSQIDQVFVKLSDDSTTTSIQVIERENVKL